MSSKNKKIFLLVFINSFVFLALCELLGLIYFYYTEDALFYTRQQAPVSAAATLDTPQQINIRLHPFWGFMPHPGTTLQAQLSNERLNRMVGKKTTPEWINIAANEYGFYSGYAYPYVPNSNEFVIGVFGGSVAQWFTLQGRKVLIDQLQQRNPDLKNRSIVILNFAQGGFKQPQQLQILTYFLSIGQHFDLVINIDGFNEAALSHLNYQQQMDLSFPSSQHVIALVSLLDQKTTDIVELRTLLKLADTTTALQAIEKTMAQNSSAGLNLVFSIMHGYRAEQYTKVTAEFDALKTHNLAIHKPSVVQLNQLPPSVTQNNEFDYIARLWANSSILMQQILDKQGIRYLHVLQPNQYYRQRVFSSKESFAMDPASPYRSGVEQGYPALLKQIDNLQNHGVNFADATSIFDAAPGIIYSDSCCHYNQSGNNRLAVYIAQKLTVHRQ